MSALYESCAGCGAETPSERCFGCFHDFGSGLTAPSNANTSGLEFSLSAVLARAICESEGKDWAALDNTREDVERWFRLGEVTAASSQARIDAAEARADRLAASLIEALPYVESCEYDNGYKPGAVLRVVKNIRAALQQETQP